MYKQIATMFIVGFGGLVSVLPTTTSAKAYWYDDYQRFEKAIRINTYAQKLSYYEYGRLVGQIDISAGDVNNKTPRGRFAIGHKHPSMLSVSAKKFMPFWMSFYQGKYGIHALPEDLYGNLATDAVIGQPAGGGCVRLEKTSAEKLYHWAELGTVVLIDTNKYEYANEKLDQQVIKNYFGLIASGSYTGAYALRQQPTLAFEHFLHYYNGITPHVIQIRHVKGSTFQVDVDLYRGDAVRKRITVLMEVVTGKIVRSMIQ